MLLGAVQRDKGVLKRASCGQLQAQADPLREALGGPNAQPSIQPSRSNILDLNVRST